MVLTAVIGVTATAGNIVGQGIMNKYALPVNQNPSVNPGLKKGPSPATAAKQSTSNNAITGYTKHGINQAISRNGVGVRPSAILNTIRNPISVMPQINGTTRITGKQATVVINGARKIVTLWANSSQYIRK